MRFDFLDFLFERVIPIMMIVSLVSGIIVLWKHIIYG